MTREAYKQSLLNFGMSEEEAENNIQCAEDLEAWNKEHGLSAETATKEILRDVEAIKSYGIIIPFPWYKHFMSKYQLAKWTLKKITRLYGKQS